MMESKSLSLHPAHETPRLLQTPLRHPWQPHSTGTPRLERACLRSCQDAPRISPRGSQGLHDVQHSEEEWRVPHHLGSESSAKANATMDLETHTGPLADDVGLPRICAAKQTPNTCGTAPQRTRRSDAGHRELFPVD